MLNKQAITKIDLDISEEDYRILRKTYRSGELPLHMKRGVNNRRIPISPSQIESFSIEDFQVYFKRTYFSLCQVLGIDVEERMPTYLMMMTIKIQNPKVNIEYDFVVEIEKGLHEGFLQVRENLAPITFRKYSLPCHLILYQNRNR